MTTVLEQLQAVDFHDGTLTEFALNRESSEARLTIEIFEIDPDGPSEEIEVEYEIKYSGVNKFCTDPDNFDLGFCQKSKPEVNGLDHKELKNADGDVQVKLILLEGTAQSGCTGAPVISFTCSGIDFQTKQKGSGN